MRVHHASTQLHYTAVILMLGGRHSGNCLLSENTSIHKLVPHTKLFSRSKIYELPLLHIFELFNYIVVLLLLVKSVQCPFKRDLVETRGFDWSKNYLNVFYLRAGTQTNADPRIRT